MLSGQAATCAALLVAPTLSAEASTMPGACRNKYLYQWADGSTPPTLIPSGQNFNGTGYRFAFILLLAGPHQLVAADLPQLHPPRPWEPGALEIAACGMRPAIAPAAAAGAVTASDLRRSHWGINPTPGVISEPNDNASPEHCVSAQNQATYGFIAYW